MNRPLFTTLVLLISINMPLTSISAAEFPLPNDPHIIVNGNGHVDQIPDIATIRFEVSAIAADFTTAKKAVDKVIGKAIKAAKKQKVDNDEINASKINASPQYEWQNKTRVYKGERVSRQVQIKLSDISRYNHLIEGLLAVGITRLQPPQLDFSERNRLENKALTLALDNAREKAKNMANHLGEKLGSVFQISPVGPTSIISHMAMRANIESKNDSAPLTPGKQKIQQQVRVVYLLKN